MSMKLEREIAILHPDVRKRVKSWVARLSNVDSAMPNQLIDMHGDTAPKR